MDLPIHPPFAPMEARSVAILPEGAGLLYEPKWDGFRALCFRSGDEIYIQSKSGQPLARYFPEIVEALARVRATHFVLDGELVVPVADRLDFDQLLQRIHPAATRVRRLAAEFPASFLAFDLLVDEQRRALIELPLLKRRPLLEAFAAQHLKESGTLRLSPATVDRAAMQAWYANSRGAMDGIIVKALDRPYRSGERDAVLKVKTLRSADCVIGGFRYGADGTAVGSLLLGLYDGAGLLHHVGFTSGFSASEKAALVHRLKPLIKPPGFTGNKPGGPSRWSTKDSEMWHPLEPSLVLEVQYDHVSNGRFRHGTKPLRFRPDKAVRLCTLDQLNAPIANSALFEAQPLAF